MYCCTKHTVYTMNTAYTVYAMCTIYNMYVLYAKCPVYFELFSRKHREGFFRAKPLRDSTQSEVYQSEVHRVKCIESSRQSQLHRVNDFIYISVYPSFFLKPEPAPMPSIGNATLTMDWRGRAREREVKLQLFPPFRRDAQPLPWIGVVERPNAR